MARSAVLPGEGSVPPPLPWVAVCMGRAAYRSSHNRYSFNLVCCTVWGCGFKLSCLTSSVPARVTAGILATWVALCADGSDCAHVGMGVARLGAVAFSLLLDRCVSARVTAVILATWVAVGANSSDYTHIGICAARLRAVVFSLLLDRCVFARVTAGTIATWVASPGCQ